ncbi:hypothetical protein LINGRAHAP2_LOCUS8418 [Linum grandiflorum]
MGACVVMAMRIVDASNELEESIFMEIHAARIKVEGCSEISSTTKESTNYSYRSSHH